MDWKIESGHTVRSAVFVFCLLTLINYLMASFSFMKHNAVTLNINLPLLPTGEQNFERVPKNIAGKSAWSSWQSERDICICTKSKLSEENGSSRLVSFAWINVLSFRCAWRIPSRLQAHGPRNVSLPKDELVELYAQ